MRLSISGERTVFYHITIVSTLAARSQQILKLLSITFEMGQRIRYSEHIEEYVVDCSLSDAQRCAHCSLRCQSAAANTRELEPKVMAHLSLALMGSFMATLDGQPVTGFRYDKVRALLAYLAVESNRSHRREHLCDLLWPEFEPELARQNLSQALYCLRRLFGGVIGSFLLADRHEIQFNLDSDYWLDVAEFSSMADEGTRTATFATLEHWERVVALYKGDFLEGFSLPDAAPFDEWVMLQREWLLRLAMDTLRRLVVGWREQSCPERALGHAWHLVELEPWEEDTHRQIMALLVECGRPGEALAQYEQCRQILRQELNVEPQSQTTDLYTAIQHGYTRNTIESQDSPQATYSSLPVQTTPLIGREQEMALIARLLANPDCRLLTITGPGGIGKSRLAFQIAQVESEDSDQNVHSIDLSMVEKADLLPTAILQELQVPSYGIFDPQRRLLAYLRDKEMLLLLDNFDHLGDGVAFVSQILQSAPTLKLIVTSRERLNLHTEWLVPLEGLALPLPAAVAGGDKLRLKAGPGQQPAAADSVGSYAAIQLFLHCARHVHSGFNPAPDEIDHIVQICQLLDGNPLAIELAAAWTRILSYEQMVKELEENLSLLATTQQDVSLRHRTMSAVFERSWRHLSTADQSLLCQLTNFYGSFTLEEASAYCRSSLVELARLVDSSWIRAMPDGRFQMYELVRKYCMGKTD